MTTGDGGTLCVSEIQGKEEEEEVEEEEEEKGC